MAPSARAASIAFPFGPPTRSTRSGTAIHAGPERIGFSSPIHASAGAVRELIEKIPVRATPAVT